MTDHDPLAGTGFIQDANAAVFAIVKDIEPELEPEAVHTVITRVAPSRAQRRRLANALRNDASLLTSGRGEGPPQIERLVRGLLALGAHRLVLPRCGHCQRPKNLSERDGKMRVCGPCYARKRAEAEPCVGCGSTRLTAGRDRKGGALCRRCSCYGDHDPIDEIRDKIVELDPGQDPEALASIIRAVIPRQFQRHKTLWELQARPDLLTGAGAHGSPRLYALIEALTAVGVDGIVVPACPFCGQRVRLSYQRDGLRCCRRCYDQARYQTCNRCHQNRPVASRMPSGEAICGNCFRNDPANHERCSGCGRVSPIQRREGDRALCHRCFRAPPAICSLCGREKPCYFASTDKPRCENCSRELQRVPCCRCGKHRTVSSRTHDGRPLCGTCNRRRERCTGCRKIRLVRARLPAGPFCGNCYRKHPASFQPCTQCGETERLHHHGLCPRCACLRQLINLLSNAEGALHPHIEPVYDLLAASEPTRVLDWLKNSYASRVLADISQDDRPITHERLDRYQSSGAIHHLRKILVAGGVLPDRDEYLAMLERWLPEATRKVVDPGERRIVRSFATWHHLRRLRSQSEQGHVTRHQTALVRSQVSAAVKLIAWLRDNGTTFATCTQRDIDRWLTEGDGGMRYCARAFVLWTKKRGYTRDIQIPPPKQAGEVARIEDDHRWNLAHRLLQDDSLVIEDRVAGLLLLLYGQPMERIAKLTRDQVIDDGAQVQLTLGIHPVELLPPFDELVSRLAKTPRGRAVIGRTDDHPWLFPGGAPGHPITANQLALRLRRLGIQPRAGRNSALIGFAGKLPAVVLSRLLGIHINSAARWARRADASNAAYAAHILRRDQSGKF